MRDPDAKKLSEKKNEASEAMPFSFEDDPGSNNSGFYELIVREISFFRWKNFFNFIYRLIP